MTYAKQLTSKIRIICVAFLLLTHSSCHTTTEHNTQSGLMVGLSAIADATIGSTLGCALTSSVSLKCGTYNDVSIGIGPMINLVILKLYACAGLTRYMCKLNGYSTYFIEAMASLLLTNTITLHFGIRYNTQKQFFNNNSANPNHHSNTAFTIGIGTGVNISRFSINGFVSLGK